MKKIIFLIPFFIVVQLFAIAANDVAKESYRVNHSFYVKNMMIAKKGRSTILAIKRPVGVKPNITRLERFLSNEYDDGVVESKDLVIIRSGHLNGVGILMTAYLDPKRSHEYLVWIPALRKVRRMAEPNEDAGLAAADIAFLEDAKLRRFYDESYELLDTKKMDLKLSMMSFKDKEFGRYTKALPHKESTLVKNRTIHILKSRHKDISHWYDYRISYIDATHFTDYLTEYYKDNTLMVWVNVGAFEYVNVFVFKDGIFTVRDNMTHCT